MALEKNILITAGDGIGPEVMGEVKKIIAYLNTNNLAHIKTTEHPIGGASIEAHGVPVTDETIELEEKQIASPWRSRWPEMG